MTKIWASAKSKSAYKKKECSPWTLSPYCSAIGGINKCQELVDITGIFGNKHPYLVISILVLTLLILLVQSLYEKVFVPCSMDGIIHSHHGVDQDQLEEQPEHHAGDCAAEQQ